MPQLPSMEEWAAMSERQRADVVRSFSADTEPANGQSLRPASLHREPRPSVSVIVTARNYGRFLRDCLSSCLKQTIEPLEVIYSDDGSTDNSISVARSFDKVRTIAHAAHEGVCAARNRAVRASRGEVLIHVDGDDILPSNFIELHLQSLTPDTPFVYCRCQAFGNGHNDLWPVPQWGEKSLWEQNFVHTSAAIWRWAFEAAGGWRENPTGTFWDWDLALRMARFGRPAVSNAVLLYRQHGGNWSHTQGELKHGHAALANHLGAVRRHNARLSIGCVWSGRLPGLFPRWLKTLANQVASECISPEQVDLVFLNNSSVKSHENLLYRETRRWQKVFSSIRILRHPISFAWKTEIERRKNSANWLAAAYTRLLNETRGEIVLFSEDDVILPRGGFKALWNTLTEGLPLVGAVAGRYSCRHGHPGWVSGWFDPEKCAVTYVPSLPKGGEPFEVDVTGTGCLMFWRDFAPSQISGHLAAIPAQDWSLCHSIRQRGRKVLLLPNVRCRHYQTVDRWV